MAATTASCIRNGARRSARPVSSGQGEGLSKLAETGLARTDGGKAGKRATAGGLQERVRGEAPHRAQDQVVCDVGRAGKEQRVGFVCAPGVSARQNGASHAAVAA
jgi:hypothetical protein